MSGSDPILELEALLDPTRLAAAWQVARERPAAAAEPSGARPGAGDPALEVEATAVDAPEVDATAVDAPAVDAPAVKGPQVDAREENATEPAEPVRTAPLPVALAHRQLLDEIERTRSASPGLADRARRVLAAPLAQLAQKIDPVDLAAAEAALDLLEDVLQALLSDAGWPERPERED